MARPEAPAVRPWFQWLLQGIPGPTPAAVAALAAGFAAIQATVLAAAAWTLSPAPPFGWVEVGETGVRSFVLAITVWMGGFFVRGAVADLRALAPVATCDERELADRADAMARFPRRGLIAASVLGALIPLGFHAEMLGRLLAGGAVALREAMTFAYLAVFYAIAVAVLYVVGVGVVRMWRFARDDVRVDLVDPTRLEPFARFGLRPALLLNIAAGLIVIEVAIRSPTYFPVALALYAPVALLGLAALALPCGSVRLHVRAAKAAELERLRRAIEGDRAALRGSPLAAEAASLSIVDLVLWRDRVESLREWPLDAAIMRRLGLYLMIPLASWVGAALVERAVDRLF